MKFSDIWWFAALVPAFACSSPEERAAHDGSGSAAVPGDVGDDDGEAVIGENKQGLVQDPNGNWVPACSQKLERCDGNTGYEICGPSPSYSGGEEWAQGAGCNSGYACQQQGSVVQCVSNNGNNGGTRTISGVEVGSGSSRFLRVTISGNPLNGGLLDDPPSPRYITYGGGPIGNEPWDPPSSGSVRDKLAFTSGNGPWVIDLEPSVTTFTPFMTDRYTWSDGSYFNVGHGTWQVSGGLYVEADNNAYDSWHLRRTAAPGSGGGGNNGGSAGPGTINCSWSGDILMVDITGPFNTNDRLLGSLSSGVLEFGNNGSNGQWDTRYLASNGRDYEPWTNDSGTYHLQMARGTQDLNFCVASSRNAPTCVWFNLNNTTSWRATGACRHDSGRTTITVN